MLLRLHVKGFKSLLDTELFFGPFTCLAGPNAAGKSNIFDAIHFLSLLSEHNIMEAASKIRIAGGDSGDPKLLFTRFGDYISEIMSIEADMIVPSNVIDEFGVIADVSRTILRYKVVFKLLNEGRMERLELIEESLTPISSKDTVQLIGFEYTQPFIKSCINGRRGTPYISTEGVESKISVHQDQRKGRKLEFNASKALVTTLGNLNSSEYPTILAAKQEMLSWKTLMLEPSSMRAPSQYRDPDSIDSRGANIASTIERLKKDSDDADSVCAELANKLSELVEDIHEVVVKDDPGTERLTVHMMDVNDIYHPARSLSDGTLRFLTLVVLSIDPDAKGLICLEEPENGIHPDRIEAMVKLLKDIAFETQYPIGMDNPLRQVLINTHSPQIFLTCDPNEVIYVNNVYTKKEDSVGSITYIEFAHNTWRSKHIQGASQLHLSFGALNAYLKNPSDSKAGQLWLNLGGK